MSDSYVLNSNHDFFWEGGQPASERAEGEEPGVRDHFFRNHENLPFFSVMERVLPWNGRRWIQFNINRQQSERLMEAYGFSADRVAEVGTAINDAYFETCTPRQRCGKRLQMSYILGGEDAVRPISIEQHLADIGNWMQAQVPVVCGAVEGLEVNIAAPGTLYLLQPTRVVARKRIERDWDLVGALLGYAPFREVFDADADRTLTVHVTGPVPIEHQADLETVLRRYQDVVGSVPESVANRLFLAFSVGTEDHPALEANGLERLEIQDIYKMANVVVFPSETEGRGLPIVESSAGGVPIICSRYYPEEVFAGVVGEHLDESLQIRYTLFPEGEFSDETLREVTDILFAEEKLADRKEHNRKAVSDRYSMRALQETFGGFLTRLEELS